MMIKQYSRNTSLLKRIRTTVPKQADANKQCLLPRGHILVS